MRREDVLQRAKECIDERIMLGGGTLLALPGPIEDLNCYVEEHAQDAEAISLLGCAYALAGGEWVSESDRLLERALGIDKSCALTLWGKGYLLYWRGLSSRESGDRGVEVLDKAIESDPTLVEAYLWKALILYDILNQPKQAYETLRTAVRILEEEHKKSAWSWVVFLKLGRSCIQHDLGGLGETLHCLERSLELNPNQDDAAMWLMLLYKELGKGDDQRRCERAYRQANRGLGIHPDTVEQVAEFVRRNRQTPSQ